MSFLKMAGGVRASTSVTRQGLFSAWQPDSPLKSHHVSLMLTTFQWLPISLRKKKKNSQAPRKAPGLLNDLISHHPSSPSHSVPATVLDSLFFWHIPDTLCVWSMHRCLHGSFPHVLQLFTQRWPSH